MDYTLILEGKNEFYPNLNNKTYNILLVDNKKKIKYMINYFKKFIELQKKNTKEKFYLAMDFEYNRVSKTSRDIALFQINLENDSNIGPFVSNASAIAFAPSFPIILSLRKISVSVVFSSKASAIAFVPSSPILLELSLIVSSFVFFFFKASAIAFAP